MDYDFQADIGANIRDFQREMREVDSLIRETALGADAMIGADLTDFQSRMRDSERALEELREGADAEIGADTAEFMSQAATVEAVTEAISTGDNDVEIGADIAEAMTEIAIVEAATEALERDTIVVRIRSRWTNYQNTMGSIANFSRSIGEVMAMTGRGISISLSPAIIPLLGSLTLLLGNLGPMLGTIGGSTFALASAFGTAGIGAAAFGAVAVTNLKDIFGASEDLKKLQEKLAETDDLEKRAKITEEMTRIQAGLNDEQKKGLDAMNSLKETWSGIAGSLQSQTIQIFTKALSTLSGVLTTLKPMFTAVTDTVNGLMDSLSRSIDSAPMQAFFGYLNTTAAPMLETITKAAGNFIQGFLSMMVAFGPLATDTAAGFLKMSEGFAAWGAQLSGNKQFQSFVDYVKENMPKIRSIFGDAIQGIINLFAGFGPSSSDMMTSLKNMMERFKEWSSTISENKGFQNFIDYIQTNGPVVVSTIGEIVTFIKNMGVALAPLGEKVLAIVNSVISWTNSMLQAHPWLGKIAAGALVVAGGLMALAPAFILANSLFGKLVLSMVKTVAKMTWTATTMVAKWAFMGVKALFHAAKMAAAWVLAMGPIGWVTTAVIAVVALIIANWDKVSAWTKKAWTAVSTAVTVAVALIMSWIEEKFPALYKIIQSYMKMAKEVISTIWEGIKGTFSNVLSFLKSLVKGDFQGMKDAISNQMELAKSTISRIWDSVKSYLSTLLGTLRDKFDEMFGKIVSKVKEKMEEAVETVGDFIGEMPGKVVSFIDDMVQAGADLVGGVISGIKSKISEGLGVIGGLATSLISRFKKDTDTHSPSRAFADIAKWFAPGIVRGLNSTSGQALDAVSTLSSNLTNAFNPQMAMADMRASATLDTSVSRADMGVVRKSFAAEIDSGEQKQQAIYVNNEIVGDKIVTVVNRGQAKKSRMTDGFYGK